MHPKVAPVAPKVAQRMPKVAPGRPKVIPRDAPGSPKERKKRPGAQEGTKRIPKVPRRRKSQIEMQSSRKRKSSKTVRVSSSFVGVKNAWYISKIGARGLRRLTYTHNFRPPLFEGDRPIQTKCFEKAPSGAPRPRIELKRVKICVWHR